MTALLSKPVRLDSIESALAQLRLGRPVVVMDDVGRDNEGNDNEGNLVFAAEFATPELLAFTVRYTSGFICVAIAEHEADRLQLPPMHRVNEARRGTAYAVTVDASEGVSTGISATDRARTIRLLADPLTQPSDLIRPGHVVPLRAKSDGVLSRAGHTEAGVDLARLAGLSPAAALCEIVSERDPGEMARAEELRHFCDRHELVMTSIASLIAHRRSKQSFISHRTQARLPLRQGDFGAVGYQTRLDRREHLALVHGDISSGRDVLVRVQSECLTADVFGSLRCGCRADLDDAICAIAREKRGVLLYLRGSEGFGILEKIKAHTELDGRPGSCLNRDAPVSATDYGIAAEILADLGVSSMRMLVSPADHRTGLRSWGPAISAYVPLNAANADAQPDRRVRSAEFAS